MRVILAFLLTTALAQEQAPAPPIVPIPPCGRHADMVKALQQKAGEFQVGIGIGEDDASILEVFASQSGTFTILVTTMLSGESCIKAFGKNFQARLPPWLERGA